MEERDGTCTGGDELRTEEGLKQKEERERLREGTEKGEREEWSAREEEEKPKMKEEEGSGTIYQTEISR